MIENVGFLDQTKNIVTDEDFDFKQASFPIAGETKFFLNRKAVAVC